MLVSRVAAAFVGGAALIAATTSSAQTISSEFVVGGLTRPVFATAAPGDHDRMFIVEQRNSAGVSTRADIRILDMTTGNLLPTPFLSVTGLTTAGEQGLLALAFHPDYSTPGSAGQGKFYVNFTGSGGTTTIREYRVSANPNIATPATGRNLLTISQPNNNHNGGWIGFDPTAAGAARNYLYIASGDGGSGNDPGNRAQNVNDLLGKMLRIDVSPTTGYGIPASNPFVGQAGRDEVWAYGLRNPWRSSFDRLTGDLWIADVGQGAREEINVQPADSTGGENYGWRLREGMIATPSGGVGGNRPAGNVDPIYDYQRPGQSGPRSSAFTGRSITGGYVYRGENLFGMQGTYFFADYVDNRIWSLEFDGSDPSQFNGTNFTDLTNLTSILAPTVGVTSFRGISSFGEDAAGELYILDYGNGTAGQGRLFKIVPEPTTWLLASLGALSLGWQARRRSRARTR